MLSTAFGVQIIFMLEWITSISEAAPTPFSLPSKEQQTQQLCHPQQTTYSLGNSFFSLIKWETVLASSGGRLSILPLTAAPQDWDCFSPILQMGNWGTERLNNLPPDSTTGIWWNLYVWPKMLTTNWTCPTGAVTQSKHQTPNSGTW